MFRKWILQNCEAAKPNQRKLSSKLTENIKSRFIKCNRKNEFVRHNESVEA